MNILVVVQRYGEEVVGGSEGHARSAAVQLSVHHQVEVATTTALDYWTWLNHFPPGDTTIDGLAVHRFPITAGRRPDFKDLERRILTQAHTLAEEQQWLAAQGPHSPALLDFLHERGRDYDAVLFYTYIYEPTAAGLPIVPERAALVSTAHDEAPLALAPYRALFQLPRAFGFLTPEERDLVYGRFNNEHIPHEILGIGMDPPPEGELGANLEGERPLLLYLGQVSQGKGVDDLIALWDAYRARGGRGTLALAGTTRMSVAQRDDVTVVGRVSEEQKWALLASADALVLPSRFESLGIVLLEAWQVGTPVLVPTNNPVTAGQVRRSGGGAAYEPESFADALGAVLDAGEAMGERGREWVRSECSWEAFGERLERLVTLAATA